MEPTLDDKVVLSDIPPGMSREKLFIHFQQKQKGGGDIQSLVMPVSGMPPNSAVIKFCDEHTVQSVLQKNHKVKSKMVDVQVQVEKFLPGIFDKVTVETNKPVLDKISSVMLDDLQEETGVKLNERTSEVEGEWYQIRTFADRLERLQNGGYDNDRSSADTLTPEQEALDKSGDVGGDEIILDKDVFAYMRLIHRTAVDNIINEYSVGIKEVAGNVIAKFKGQMADDGISIMQKLYTKTQDELVQVNHDLPLSITDRELRGILQKVQECCKETVVVSKSPNRPTVMFIGGSKEDCQKAVDVMKVFDGSGFKYSSPVSTSIDNREQPPLSTSFGNHGRRALPDTPENVFEFKFRKTGLKIQVIQGDIAAQHAEAIVNAANKELHDGGGVTGAIYRAGGYSFRESCKDLMRSRRYKDLGLGEIVHVQACGGLKCSWVIHAVGPEWHYMPKKNRENECRKTMTRILGKLIDHAAHTLKCSSISIPAIGTGVYGVPIHIFCEAMLEVVRQHQKDLSKTPSALLDIRLVNFDYIEAGQIASHFKRGFNRLNESAV